MNKPMISIELLKEHWEKMDNLTDKMALEQALLHVEQLQAENERLKKQLKESKGGES